MNTYCNNPVPSDTQHFRVEGITTCVDYSDFLNESLNENLHHFDEFVVVTSYTDNKTREVCERHGVICVQTDLFEERNCDKFNKGMAINLGLAYLTHQDWLVHMDADIILPDRFRSMVEKSRLNKECVHGADRLNVKSYKQWQEVKNHQAYNRQYQHKFIVKAPNLELGARLIHNEFGYCPIGYFQMWHASQKKRYPYNQGSAEHTDVLFSCQWPAQNRILLPSILVYHLESEEAKMGANWTGRTTKLFKP